MTNNALALADLDITPMSADLDMANNYDQAELTAGAVVVARALTIKTPNAKTTVQYGTHRRPGAQLTHSLQSGPKGPTA